MACFSLSFLPFIKLATRSASFLTPKKTALFITIALHCPLFFVNLKWPTFESPPPLAAVEVQLGLEKALEVALTKPKKSWYLQTFGLPELSSQLETPSILYSSNVLIDAFNGTIIWAKPHPLLDEYLSQLRFASSNDGPRLVSGYIATGPKE